MTGWLQFAIPTACEIFFLFAAIYCVHRAEKSRIYPAFWQLLIFWAASDVVLLGEGIVRHLHLISGVEFYSAYFFTYWPVFAINAILVLRVLHEMFRHAVRSIPGVQMLGRPIFFWAIAVSTILAFVSSVAPHTSGTSLIFASAQVLARAQSVLALCMIAFLAFASRTLGVSFGSRIFGVAFGFGLMATANLINAALLSRIPQLASHANIALEVVNLIAITVWAVYFLKPEPVRRLVTMPVTSPLMRWNDIAQTLGNPSGQVAISYPPSFMTDVFELVNNVMGPVGAPPHLSTRPSGPIAS